VKWDERPYSAAGIATKPDTEVTEVSTEDTEDGARNLKFEISNEEAGIVAGRDDSQER
jgi:hypothetical protein